MTNTPRTSIGLMVLVGSLVGGSLQADTIFSNTENYLGKFSPGEAEVGDQIFFAGSARQLTSFEFQIFNTSLVEAAVRFYRMDGSLLEIGTGVFVTKPGTTLFDSGWFAVGPDADGQKLTINQFSAEAGAAVGFDGMLPDGMTWSIQFRGAGAAGSSIAVFHQAEIGSSYIDYWDRGTGNWALLEPQANAPIPSISFGATFTAVPEPSTMALSLLGLAGFAGLAIKRRMA